MSSVGSVKPLRRLLVVTAALLMFGAAGALPVWAATQTPSSPPAASGITLSPTLKELVISSGLIEAPTTIVLTNRTGHDLAASIRLVDFSSLNQYGGVSFGEAGLPIAKYALAKWMILPGGNTVALPSGQSVQVPVSIVNRSDLAPGGHYGAVVATISTSTGVDANNVNLKQQLVSLVFVNKLGGEQYGLQLQSLAASARWKLPSSVSLHFRSTGNVHVVPRGYVTVADPTGKIVAKGLINPESTLVLPGTSRQFVTTLSPVGSSQIPGRYTVTAHYRYEEQTQFATMSVHIYPWRWSLALIPVVIFAGAVIVMQLRRLLRNRRDPKRSDFGRTIKKRY